jgi:hypothetical protein
MRKKMVQDGAKIMQMTTELKVDYELEIEREREK